MAGKVTGRVTFEVDGEVLESEAGATINVGGVNREAVISETGKVFPMETSVPATIECSILHVGETDLVEIAGFVDKTLNFKCDSGQMYTVKGAFLTEPPSLSGGKASLKWSGQAAKFSTI
jgi:hypothetical protein